MNLKEKWHRILGHVNFGYLNTLCKQELLMGIPNKLESEFMKCKTCIENKVHNLPFSNNRIKAKDILEIVHTDVYGPLKRANYQFIVSKLKTKFFIAQVDLLMNMKIYLKRK